MKNCLTSCSLVLSIWSHVRTWYPHRPCLDRLPPVIFVQMTPTSLRLKLRLLGADRHTDWLTGLQESWRNFSLQRTAFRSWIVHRHVEPWWQWTTCWCVRVCARICLREDTQVTGGVHLAYYTLPSHQEFTAEQTVREFAVKEENALVESSNISSADFLVDFFMVCT